MENTLENKAKFFAQYWGQKVLTRPHCGGKMWILGEEVSIQSALSKQGYDYQYFLELKPLSSITDEDATEVDRIFYDFVNHEGNAFVGKNLIFSSPDISRLPSVVCDYLRSKGYALPWMGLSVEDLVNFSWIKLKEN